MSNPYGPDPVPPLIAGPPITNPPLPFPAATPKHAIRAMIAQVSNFEVAWTDDKQVLMGMTGGPKAWIYLTYSGVKALGYDEERTQNDPVNIGSLQYNMCGQRVLTITCRAESIEQGVYPQDMLERVRWSQRSALAADLLTAAGLCLSDYGDIHVLGSTAEMDNRRVRVAIMELKFNRALNSGYVVYPQTGEPGASPQSIDTVNESEQSPGSPITIIAVPAVTPE